MKSNKMKKIVAFICVFTMLLNMLPLTAWAGEERTSYDASEIEKPQLTAITMADFGIKKRGDLPTDNLKTYNGGDSLINTVLVQNMTFSGKGGNYINYGVSSDVGYRGIQIRATAAGHISIYYNRTDATKWETNYTFDASNAGNIPLVDQERTWKFELFVDPNNSADALFGISVDGILLDNKYYVCKNGVEDLSNALMPQMVESGTYIKVGNPALATLVENMTPITMSDFNIKKETYTYNGSDWCVGGYGKYNGTLINTVLTQKMTFSDHRNNIFMYGTCDDYGFRGIQIITQDSVSWGSNVIQITSNRTNVTIPNNTYLGAGDFNMDSLFDKELVWTFELFQDPNNAENALLGIYVNGNLGGNKYITVTGANNLGTSVTLQVNNQAGSIGIGAPALTPDDMVDITAKSFGIDNNKYSCVDPGLSIVYGEYSGDSLLGTTFTQKMTFSEHANTHFRYAGPGTSYWKGIQFTTDTNIAGFRVAINIANVDWTSTYDITPQSVGQEKLLGEELEWKLELFQDPYNANDVLLGVYIDGTLWNNTYMRFNGIAESLGNQFGIQCATTEGWVQIGEKEQAPEINPNFVQLSANSYNVEDGVYAYTDGNYIAVGDCGRTDMNGVVFSDKLFFSKGEGAKLTIGGSTEGRGIHWTISGGQLVAKDYTTGVIIETFDPVTAGVESFVETSFTLTISFEYIDYQGDGSTNDIKLGVWFNGKAYNDSWLYIKDTDTSQYGKSLGIISSNARAYLGIGREVELCNLAVDSSYTITGEGSFTVNGDEVVDGRTLSKPGDYLITCTTGEDTVTKHVFLYSLEDAHPDGDVDVKDLVAVKKVMSKVSLATFAGTEAADTNADGKVDETDRTALCGRLLQ